MVHWQGTIRGHKKQSEAIASFLDHIPRLVDFLSDPDSPKLNDASERRLTAARGLPSSDFLLVRIAKPQISRPTRFSIPNLRPSQRSSGHFLF